MSYANCMDTETSEFEIDPDLRNLYPHLNDDQLREVQDTLDRYLELFFCISFFFYLSRFSLYIPKKKTM